MIDVIIVIVTFMLGIVSGVTVCYFGFKYGYQAGVAISEGDKTEVEDMIKKYREPAEFELLADKKKE